VSIEKTICEVVQITTKIKKKGEHRKRERWRESASREVLLKRKAQYS
jgi:hypothetical protein